MQLGVASVPAPSRGQDEWRNQVTRQGPGHGGPTRDVEEPNRDSTSKARDRPTLVIALMGEGHGSEDRGTGQA